MVCCGTGHFVQCHQNQVVTVTTWEDLCGAGQIDRHHFSIIKSRVYSAFWGFRYVRMYRFCTHVHSKKAKSSHIQDFSCSHAGNSQVSCSIRNVSKGVGDSPPPRWQGKGVVKHDSWNNISSACDQIGHIQFKGVTNGYTLWSLSPNGSVRPCTYVHSEKARFPHIQNYRSQDGGASSGRTRASIPR